MMLTGPIPTASIWGTWAETVEIVSVDDGTLYDLSGVAEIIIKLRDPYTHFDEFTLSKSHGDITVPSAGIIQWQVDAAHMGSLAPKVYEIIMLLETDDPVPFVLPFILGSISIVE